MKLSDFYDIVSRNVGQYTYSLNIPEIVVRRQFDSSTGTWEQYQILQPYPVEEARGIVPFNKGATITTGIKVRGAVIVNWGVNGSVNRTLTMNLFNGETTKTSNGVKFSFNTSTSKLTMTNVSATNYNQANFEIGTIDARSILGIIVTPTDKALTTYNDIEDISYTCDGQTYNVNVADFSNCNNLEYLNPTVFSNSNHIVTLDGCFANCTSLVSVPVLPAGVKKMYRCFSGCVSLVEVPVGNIPNGVEDMAYCFYNCSSLTHAYLPDGVLYIDYCFRGCSLLSALPLTPSSVVSMGGYYKSSSITLPPALPNRVINISDCFSNCNSLSYAPVIPTTVKDIEECFKGCVALKGDIYIYTDNLASIRNCFMGTTQPIILHTMNNNTSVCKRLAKTANNNNVLLNVHPETSISFTDTQMNYMTNEGLKALSLQTNADLVQCEIPDLINGGTITTNVNDALIDLYYRGVIVEYEYLVSGTISSNGITITNNRDGSFTINGTARDYVTQPLLRVTLRPSEVYMMTGGYVAQNIFVGTYNTGMFSDGTTFGGDGAVCDESILFPSNMISVTVCFRVIEGNTINNITIRPRIVKAGDA